MSRFRRCALPMAMFGALALSASAQAQTTIGQVAPPNPNTHCVQGPFDIFPNEANQPAYAAPVAGVLTSWSTSAGAGAGQTLQFKVFRKTAPNKYEVVAQDAVRPLAPSVLNTFKVAIPVQAGDLIGDNDLDPLTAHNACDFETGNPVDGAAFFPGNAPVGTTIKEEEEESGFRVNVSATLLPPPTVATLGTKSGSVKGHTSVVIAGANFAEVQGVSFGAVPVTFTVNSETQITAVAPKSAKVTKVPVSLTTVAGTTMAPTKFAYKGCVVPNIKGKTLKAAKKKLKKADCRLGKVKGEKTKTARVKKQGGKPRKVLAPGSKVGVKLEG